MEPHRISAEFPEKCQFLFEPHRYKVLWGGRGGAKSWAVARSLLLLGAKKRKRILCGRETMKSIADSSFKLLCDQIRGLGLDRKYQFTKSTIEGTNGTEFLFAGLKHNVTNIKSVESVDIAWIEEAEAVTKDSWETLIPSIRKDGSEIWVTFNPDLETDDTYQRFVVRPPETAKVVKINWRDNPWFPKVLKDEMDHLRSVDPEACDHVYEGSCKSTASGAIYAKQLMAADAAGRIQRVPYDVSRPVHTSWDLGFGDLVAIWFFQSFPFEYRLIDYLEGSRQAIGEYLKMLQAKPYLYGTSYLPWDGKSKQLGTGRSIEEQMRSAGFKTAIAPRLSVVDGIEAGRVIFSQCFFDSAKCADGLQALRHYRYGEIATLGTPTREPLHDWASHAADAFRTFAVGVRPPKIQDHIPQAARPLPPAPTSPWV